MQIHIHKILLTLFFFSFAIHFSNAQDAPKKNIGASTEKDTLQVTDSVYTDISDLIKPKDSTQTDSVVKSKSAIEFITSHKAVNVIRNDFRNNLTIFENEAEIEYGTTKINAGFIEINHNTNVIFAKGILDSLGVYTQQPVVVQDGQTSVHDSIKLNSKSERVIAYGTDAELGGLLTNTGIMKKVNDSVIYIRDVIITTSEKEIPDYHIWIDKGKMIPEKKIIASTAQMYIAEVPTPIILPFAYFPLTQGRTSGIIMPSYGTSQNQGFFLQNGGYYLAVSEYFDLTATGDIYTNSSWALNLQSNYKVRYKFSGGFSFRFENLYTSLRGLDDFGHSSNYNIRWNHSQDGKSNPNARFSASVNMGSSKYYKQSLNEYNSNSFLNNTLSSSISYQKRFVGAPFNMSVSMTHSQNTNTEQITMTLPSLQVSMDRIYPFEPKNGPKKNALHNMGVVYNFKGDYRINTTDEFFFKPEMFESAKAGVQQDVGLSTSMKVMKHFSLSPSGRYKEVWYFDKVNKYYDNDTEEVVTDTIKGFNAFREYNAGVSLTTTLYGDVAFKKGRLEAIRHTMRPSVSYNYKPDFGFYYEEVQQSPDPNDVIEYSPYQNGLYGGPSNGLSNSIGLSIGNTLEAKIKSKDSTDTESKKIKLLNNFNVSSSYNIAADSLKWSPMSLNAGTSFFDNKMSVNLRATLDPYAIDINGRKIDIFNINNGGSLFRLTNAGLTMNYVLSSETFKKEGGNNSDARTASSGIDPTNSEGIFGQDMTATNESSPKKGENEVKTSKLYRSTMPWSLRIAYAFNYANSARQNDISSHSIMFSGDVELTPKWEVGFSSGYDIKSGGFTYTQLRFNRDLDSWRMSFNWVPFGPRTTYNFYIGIKSSILSDVKYDQRKTPDKRLF